MENSLSPSSLAISKRSPCRGFRMIEAPIYPPVRPPKCCPLEDTCLLGTAVLGHWLPLPASPGTWRKGTLFSPSALRPKDSLGSPPNLSQHKSEGGFSRGLGVMEVSSPSDQSWIWWNPQTSDPSGTHVTGLA